MTPKESSYKLKALLKKGNAPETASWSARLPVAEQDSLAAKLLAKPSDRYFITFEGDTDIPEGITNPGPGMVHMASFNYAYKLKPQLNGFSRSINKILQVFI